MPVLRAILRPLFHIVAFAPMAYAVFIVGGITDLRGI